MLAGKTDDCIKTWQLFILQGREDPMLFSQEYIPPLVRPDWHRNKLKYRLERMDCIRRRNMINIPEFYPGSIVAVTVSDQYAPGKSMKYGYLLGVIQTILVFILMTLC